MDNSEIQTESKKQEALLSALIVELSAEQIEVIIDQLRAAREDGFARIEISYKNHHVFSITYATEKLLPGAHARNPGKRSPSY